MTAERREALADRVGRLGTETAFAVSAEAAEWTAQGNTVYPFHLGDMDLPTPENIVDAAVRAIADGKTGYCPNAGIPPLREALAADVGASHGVASRRANVVIEPGGKPVIGKFILALMNPGDEVLYPNPGYPIYESQIEFHGGVRAALRLRRGTRRLRARLRRTGAQVTPRTRLLVFNNLQNPTGAESSPAGARARRRVRARATTSWCSATRPTGTSATPAQAARSRRCRAWQERMRHPLHVQQEVRDDRLAPRRGHRTRRRSSTSSPSST